MDTYNQFTEQNRELLASLPPPLVALEYYKGRRPVHVRCPAFRTQAA